MFLCRTKAMTKKKSSEYYCPQLFIYSTGHQSYPSSDLTSYTVHCKHQIQKVLLFKATH